MGFQQGLSGLNATSKNLEVIGNNVANANTFGFKSARAEFADMYATSMNGTGASNIGIGVNLAAVAQQFTQGNIVTTENPMDLALNGAGFFQVTDGKSPVSYTRNGQFKVDREGWVVNNAGEKLLGYPADGTGVIQPGTATPLRMPTSGIDPAATANMSIEMNLDSRAAVTKPSGTPQIVLNDTDTYNNATSVTVFDAKGQDVALTYYFQKTGTDTWDVFVTANGSPISTDASGNPLPSTSLTFNSSGSALITPSAPVSIDIPASTNSNGAQTLAITGVQLDLSNATQNGSSFAVTDLTQDGYAPGQMVGIQFEPNGVVTARYSNGQSKPAGQVEIANFRNPQGLVPLGGNGWSRSYASGEPVLGVPGDGNLGVIQSGALEESNVDLTGELVNMITAQRIYQANAQTIKTEDQVMQTLVNLR